MPWATLLSFLGSGLAKIFTDKVLSFVAYRALLVFLFTVIVPIVLNNFIYDLMEIMLNFANAQSVNTLNGAMSFTGFAAWLLECFKISEVFSVLISALVLRVSLRMIPFVRL